MNKLVAFFGVLSFIVLFFLAYPLLALVLSVNLELLGYAVKSPVAVKALTLTLEAATFSTILLLFLGVPLAYVLARYSFKGKGFIEALIDLPLVIPHAVVGIMLLIAFGPRTGLGGLLEGLGVVLENSFWAIVAVFMFVGAPLLIDCAKDGFASVSPSLEGVARCMGAGPARVFITVSLPLAARSIFTGALLAWARAMSEVGALLIIAYYPKTVNVLVIEWFNTYGLGYAVALTAILLLISITVFVILRALLRWKH
ncbi:MAG: tungstate/molybdate transporter permease [Thermoprotei archaeon]|nr:MAG: tungstate/molybdate transporter permease [Thermoprotei archaeon]